MHDFSLRKCYCASTQLQTNTMRFKLLNLAEVGLIAHIGFCHDFNFRRMGACWPLSWEVCWNSTCYSKICAKICWITPYSKDSWCNFLLYVPPNTPLFSRTAQFHHPVQRLQDAFHGTAVYAVVSLWHGWQRTVATVRSTTRMRPPRPIVYISAFTAPYLKALWNLRAPAISALCYFRSQTKQ